MLATLVRSLAVSFGSICCFLIASSMSGWKWSGNGNGFGIGVSVCPSTVITGLYYIAQVNYTWVELWLFLQLLAQIGFFTIRTRWQDLFYWLTIC